jgi:hypothetical protein
MENNLFTDQVLINMFQNIWDIDNQNQEKNCPIRIPLELIKTGAHGVAQKIQAIRNAATKEERDRLKLSLYTVMWQGIFTLKNNNGCVSLSSLVCIDLDHQAQQDLNIIKQTISSWPYVLGFFKSPSGDGLKVIVRTDNYSIPDYGNCYRQVEQLFTDAFGIRPDKLCEDLSHPCFISYDPNMYCNPNAQPWHYVYNPAFDKPNQPKNNGSSNVNATTQPDATPLTYDQVLAQMGFTGNSLLDDEIIRILDFIWQPFSDINLSDGNRTRSIYIQAHTLSKAGVHESTALDYLRRKFLPTRYDANKLQHEVHQAYIKSAHLFGTERDKYKPYYQYKQKP